MRRKILSALAPYIGIELRNRRVLAALTQHQAADELGMLRTVLSRLESGRTSPCLETLETCAAFYRCEVSAILAGAEAVRDLDAQAAREADVRSFQGTG